MTDLLPLFPLPNVVLFPNVFLPLHIFEPRYRAMVADAIAGDRMIGMVLLRPGWEHDYEGRPPVFAVGCSGVITHVEQLADGRYNIVLRGSRALQGPRGRPLARLPARHRGALDRTTDGQRGSRRRPPAAGEARSDAGRLARIPGSGPEDSVGDERRGSRERARAVSRLRTAREAGAARASTACGPAPSRSSSCSRSS